ncbi:hypothetical protein [Crossiella sp. CA198]|uniref:hypothetical protein n=1 Tax=Crossiella sp. CA198 TaxID=3455607 RepID=UPI003F8D40A4
MPPIESVESRWPDPPPGWSTQDWRTTPAAERHLHVMRELLARNGLPRPTGMDETQQVHARLDHGRWLVQCPGCASAQHAAHSDPRFYCVNCGNRGSGQWWPVVWPAERTEVETQAQARSGPVMWAHAQDPSLAARDVRQRIDPPRRPARPPHPGR